MTIMCVKLLSPAMPQPRSRNCFGAWGRLLGSSSSTSRSWVSKVHCITRSLFIRAKPFSLWTFPQKTFHHGLRSLNVSVNLIGERGQVPFGTSREGSVVRRNIGLIVFDCATGQINQIVQSIVSVAESDTGIIHDSVADQFDHVTVIRCFGNAELKHVIVIFGSK